MSNVFIFNPSNEMAVADGGNGFIPERQIRQFETDLEVLPFIFSKKEDIVIVENQVNTDWIEYMKKIRGEMPQFMKFEELHKHLKNKSITINKFSPWGWSPRMLKILEPFVKYLPESELNLPNYRWNPNYKEVYGRQTALKILTGILNNYPNRKKLIPDFLKPVCITSISEATNCIKNFSEAVFKTPYSSSGRGIMLLKNNCLNTSNINWISANIRKFGFLMFEPYLNKLLELSAQFFLSHKTCKFINFSSTLTNSKGGYEGNFVRAIPIYPSLNSFLQSVDLKTITDTISEVILSNKIDHCYNGYFGVDMMIFKRKTNDFYIQPCLEINLRYNMGILSHFLSDLISFNSYGLFRIISVSDSHKNNYIENIVFDNENKIISGRLYLTPVTDRKHIAVVDVKEIE